MGSSSPWEAGPSSSPDLQHKSTTEETNAASRPGFGSEADSQTLGIAGSDLSLTELLRLAHDGIIVSNIDGIIQFWNRGAEEMYGWSLRKRAGISPLISYRRRVPAATHGSNEKVV